MEEKQFEVRDLRSKEKFLVDDRFLNGYAKFTEIYSVGIYNSLCRHVNKEQKCWPSIKKIAEELSISRNKVIEGIKYLEFWNIIKKIRIGKQATNRYLLIDKKQWKSISEVHLKDFSEVYHKDFKGLRGKLHGFTTRTSNSKETHSKETHSKDCEAVASPSLTFSYKEKLQSMQANKQRHIQVIALYWKYKGIEPQNEEQYQALLKRELKMARNLAGFSDERITEVMDWLEKEETFKWGMETIFKYITENLKRIKAIK